MLVLATVIAIALVCAALLGWVEWEERRQRRIIRAAFDRLRVPMEQLAVAMGEQLVPVLRNVADSMLKLTAAFVVSEIDSERPQ